MGVSLCVIFISQRMLIQVLDKLMEGLSHIVVHKNFENTEMSLKCKVYYLKIYYIVS